MTITRRTIRWTLLMATVLAAGLPAPAQTPPAAPGPLSDDNPRVTPVVRAYRTASPAVVNISTTQLVRARIGRFGDDLFDRIFPAPSAPVEVSSLGSGVIIHPSGLVITNAHVVRRARQITVTLADGRQFEARAISAQADYDLAVLRLESNGTESFPYLPLGRSDDLMVGETVIAIGNPLGYAGSVTTGVVSAVGRELNFGGEVRYDGLIQTDAPINPGNSGGPLLNILGELIGINTAIHANAQNIGFAIPAETIATELAALLDFEQIHRLQFGARVRHVRQGEQAVAQVEHVVPGSPADGSLQPGDRILDVDGAPVRHVADFLAPMMLAQSGQTVRMTVQRGGERAPVAVELARRSQPDGAALAQRLLGLGLRPITPGLARDLQLPLNRGLLITQVGRSGPAVEIGIRPRDILFQVDNLYVANLEDLGGALETVQPGRPVRLGIIRGNVATWVTVRAIGEIAQSE